MKRTLMLAALVAITTVAVQAQTSTPQTTNNQTANNGKVTTQMQNGNTANLPYSSQVIRMFPMPAGRVTTMFTVARLHAMARTCRLFMTKTEKCGKCAPASR